MDESNHGLYLLNYSDTENVTQNPEVNIATTTSNEEKEIASVAPSTTTVSNVTLETTTAKIDEEERLETNTIANSTDTKIKVGNDKDNHTLFLSEEIYKHFRPLETELPVEDMAPFIYFGQKLGGGVINDNLTNSPSLSASTKSVNFIVAPPDKRKFNSRYSATEKYKNTSADEEEINEDMDVSVVKNVIEKNKIRNTVKGPAPARHVGLVNAYRKFSSSTPGSTKAPNIAQLNVTEPIVSSATPNIIDFKESSSTETVGSSTVTNNNSTTESYNKTTSTATPRNFTRNYFNLRRRPARLTTLASTESVIPTVAVNTTTTEKASTVYTAVVTSVSITSSMKGQNKTDSMKESESINVTSTSVPELTNVTTIKVTPINETDTTSTSTTTSTTTAAPSSSSSQRPYRHRIRIRTTTTESSLTPISRPLTSDTPRQIAIRNETVSKISDRLATLFRPTESTNVSTIRPKNILRRRRPTTTTTTTTTTPEPSEPSTTVETSPLTQTFKTTDYIGTSTYEPFVVTSRSSSESRHKPSLPKNTTESSVNTTADPALSHNEEVVIEAEKTYTASYVLAGLGFLPVAAIIAFVLRSILNKKTKEIDAEYEGYFDEGGDIKKESPITPVARPPLPTPSKPDQKWEFPRNKLRLQTLLGQGNFGQVSRFKTNIYWIIYDFCQFRPN